jgi:hypothetical protein
VTEGIVTALVRATFVVLVYIGNRQFKEDNVCKTGVVWHGYGDKQQVDQRLLPRFLQHPDVWCLEEDFEKLPARGVNGCAGTKYTTTHNEDGTITLTPVAESEEAESGQQESSSQDTGNQETEANSENETKITNAILSLEQGNDNHFSKSNGVPILSAVRNAAGDESITGEQVKAAWTKLKAN